MSADPTEPTEPAPSPDGFVLDPPLDDGLGAQLIRCWTDVTNAGGAVGLVAPVDVDDVLALAVRTFARLHPEGPDHLLVLPDGHGGVAAWCVLEAKGTPLSRHWMTVKRVQVRPDLQGRGLGRALLQAVARTGRELGLDALHLTVRSGTGTDAFYRGLGWAEVARIPAAIRVAPGDDRDEIYMVLDLRPAAADEVSEHRPEGV